MKICGVELTGNDAVICLLNQEGQLFDIGDCRVRSLQLPKEHTRSDLQYFQTTFCKLMEDYKVDRVVIRERLTKGKFAGSAAGFKMEATLQLIEELDVHLLRPSEIKEALSESPLPIDFSETGLKGFQETAFITAYAAHQLL